MQYAIAYGISERLSNQYETSKMHALKTGKNQIFGEIKEDY